MTWHEGAQRIIHEAGVSQEMLMPVFGVQSRGAVSHYLTGRRQPRPDQLKRLADFLQVRIDDFFPAKTTALEFGSQSYQALTQRLSSASNTSPPPFGRRYDWSNPDGLDQNTLTLKVLSAGRFDDLLTLARRVGIDALEQALERDSEAHPDLRDRPFLRRKLANIRKGLAKSNHAA